MPSLVRKNDNNWRCLVGVGVSGWCMDGIWGWLEPSGLCPVYIDAKSIEKSQLDIVLMSYRSFFQWSISAKNRLIGRNFQRGVVGFFSGSMANSLVQMAKLWTWEHNGDGGEEKF